MQILGEKHLGIGHSECRGPGGGKYACLRTSKASKAGVE